MPRNPLYDIVKGIGIILVVIGHCIDSQSYIGHVIWAFHMPLFFITSGIFLSQKYSFCEFVKKKSKRLLVPLFVFSVILIVGQFITGNKDFTYLYYSFPTPMWFLFVLFVSECIFFYLINKGLYVLLGGMIVLIIISLRYPNLPYSLSSIGYALMYLVVGKLAYNRLWNNVSHAAYLPIFTLVVLFLVKVFNIEVMLHVGVMKPFLLALLCSITGCMAVYTISKIILCKTLTLSRIIEYLGNNSIIIMCLHMLYISLFLFLVTLLDLDLSKLLYKGLEQFFVWTMCIVSIITINSKAKWMIGR